jgi:hypothetical protein
MPGNPKAATVLLFMIQRAVNLATKHTHNPGAMRAVHMRSLRFHVFSKHKLTPSANLVDRSPRCFGEACRQHLHKNSSNLLQPAAIVSTKSPS